MLDVRSNEEKIENGRILEKEEKGKK